MFTFFIARTITYYWIDSRKNNHFSSCATTVNSYHHSVIDHNDRHPIEAKKKKITGTKN